MSVDYLLHESSVGYAVFKVRMQADSIGNRLKEVQEQHTDLSKFGKMVELISFAPFQGAQQALENANDISEGLVSPYLRTVLEAALPKAGKKNKVSLGVTDKNLAGAIKDSLPGLQCETGETSEIVADLLRGVRLHSEKLLGKLQEGDVGRAQLGLGHAYSRAKVKFSVQKNDNHIIQAIATIDQLDKACNTFAMRVREWYGWHFPELVRIASDNSTYAKLALFIGDKKTLSEESLHDLAALVGDDEATARSIIDAARVSMGQDISEEDMENVMSFAKRVVSLTTYRKTVGSYLVEKMGSVAPNVAALIGETVGARLIQKAGSLTNLAKYPASTVQILGAEKALFRALKTKGNTPKYGLIYHSSFIGRAGAKNKGRISRFLANKTSIASRIDLFSEAPSTKFGLALRDQVEERLEFYATGKPPTKNQDAMKSALASLLADSSAEDPTAGAEEEAIPAPGVTGGATEAALRKEKKKSKEGKKDKKRRSDADGDVSMADAAVADPAVKGAELAEEVERGNAGERKEKKKDKKDNKRRRSEGAGEGEVDDEEEERRRRKKEKKEKRKSGAS